MSTALSVVVPGATVAETTVCVVDVIVVEHEAVRSSQLPAGTPLSWASTVASFSRKYTISAGAGITGVKASVGTTRAARSEAPLGPRSKVVETSSPQPYTPLFADNWYSSKLVYTRYVVGLVLLRLSAPLLQKERSSYMAMPL